MRSLPELCTFTEAPPPDATAGPVASWVPACPACRVAVGAALANGRHPHDLEGLVEAATQAAVEYGDVHLARVLSAVTA